MKIDQVVGVDFSGAKLAGRNIWLAFASPDESSGGTRLTLDRLARLESLAGAAEREPALSHLVKLISGSTNALWGIDFPFGLPIELWREDFTWREQLAHVHSCGMDAQSFGRWCVAEALKIGTQLHIRRTTDRESKTPFDCYHYRIIFQTLHGMRDVLRPLLDVPATAIPPFTPVDRRCKRIVVEACPGSTLKRLGLPHQNYKQPAGGPLTAKRLKTRRMILDGLQKLIEIRDSDRRTIQRNPGGDALDAVIAAVGTLQAWQSADHAAIAAHLRYAREGLVFY